MGDSIPQPFKSTMSGPLGTVGQVIVSGIPDTFIHVEKLPKTQLGIDPLTVDPITLPLEPVELSMRIEEIPNVRGHLPADFSVGLSPLGIELMCVRLFGESQMITEPMFPTL